jgi:peroxiredoxin
MNGQSDKMKRFILFACLLMICGGFGIVSAQNINDLSLKDVDGNAYSIKTALSRGPILLAFWATWCKPCRKELPALKSIYETYADSGLSILAISQDAPRSLGKVRSYITASDLPYHFLIDPNGEQSSRLYVRDVPYLILTDRSGRVVYTHRGYRNGDEIEVEEQVIRVLKSGQ